MITLSVRGLPRSTTEESLTALFTEYGVVRSLKMAKDLFSGDCKGFATIDMEGHEARAAIAALDGSELSGSMIRVGPDRPRKGRGGKRR
ncbi:MAG: RNA-binding protein [Candidatus Thiodiazotropha sp.]|nr:RNA-binding protein [Candidatus Thiodiazotropha sp.]MCU7802371.1 RNA-binding protein [Candidatus Thiodiazotropha sp. (ex Lucinoma borealis)]MCU7841707.1 RNA-binding protein [Candidatus Thiodiazotropha sp. (ex Troendleina suluensis)]MCU7883374.1 RNA-binding protein [Candidatus Thiodiazotropha sp. (ex Lucinoma annulata)]MCU7931271.1 RNA-binding protein [Candidatus Thiodiazotropha sp. (ex Codakia rugifera)]